jgi:uncharacterized alpha/beta hydrolase family protein
MVTMSTPMFGIHGEVDCALITFRKCIIMFQECGFVEEHAMELNNIVNRILHNMGSEKVNIVAHSKGGLDARWYIAHYGIR